MKILILTRYSRKGASSRLRLFQYLPLFEAAGIRCEPLPLLNDRYLDDVYAGRRPGIWNIARCYWTVFRRLLRAKKYDAVILEKEIFPFLPPLAEAWLGLLRVPYIVDYDDAIFHNYDLHPNALVRFCLGGKIPYVMRKAALVVCGNAYLQCYAAGAGARNTVIIPTVIDPLRYEAKAGRPAGGDVIRGDTAPGDAAAGDVIIGWIGSPSSVRFLKRLSPVLRDLVDRYPVKLHIIGGGSGIGLGEREEILEWTEDRECALLGALDIGIMPLEDSPWERGKCGYKLIQYMGCGLPVVGSPVGVNGEIIADGVTGFVAGTGGEWSDRLGELIADAGLRKVMGAAGRRRMLEKYSLDTAGKTWLSRLEKIKV